MGNSQNTEVDLLEAQLPDILAISSAEVTLPTLNMNSSELAELSLSGIINTIGISPGQDQGMNVVQVDSNTIQGQNQPITFHLHPMEEQVGPVRDVRDNIQGFAQSLANTTTAYQEFQNLLSPEVAPVEKRPFVRILEQPASHKLRFRYKCEGRGAGALQGERSSPEKKTFPKIQIVGYKGPAVVVVSCVTHDSEVSHSDLVKILGQEAAQDDEMQNLSDKLDEFSLGHGAPLNISPVPVNTSRVGGKRTSKEAENDSASILIPRQMERQQSSITTPNVSSNLSEILQNCKQINDL